MIVWMAKNSIPPLALFFGWEWCDATLEGKEALHYPWQPHGHSSAWVKFHERWTNEAFRKDIAKLSMECTELSEVPEE